jgi:hypothetical protein
MEVPMRAWVSAMVLVGVAALGSPALGQASDEAEALRQRIAELQAELESTRAELAEVLKAEPAAGAEATPATDEVPLAAGPPDAEPAEEPPEAEAGGAVAPGAAGAGADAMKAAGGLPAWLRDWDSSVEFGLSGSEGNARRHALRFVYKASRNTERTETSFQSYFRMTSQDSADSLKQFTLDARNDWINQNKHDLRYFVQGKVEFDDAQAWDHRVSGFGGVGYAFIKDEKTTLVGRGGFGGSKRAGVPDDDFRAEAFLAADLTHAISERQKLQAGFEYLPDTSGWRAYRLNADASWELKIDPDNDLYLRMGVASRYDSDPGSARSNDLDYFVNLGWTF